MKRGFWRGVVCDVLGVPKPGAAVLGVLPLVSGRVRVVLSHRRDVLSADLTPQQAREVAAELVRFADWQDGAQ